MAVPSERKPANECPESASSGWSGCGAGGHLLHEDSITGTCRKDIHMPGSEREGPSGRRDDLDGAVADVLRDQVERARRREEVSRSPEQRRGPLVIAAVVLAAFGGALWLARPDWTRPEPLPRRTPQEVEDGLRMDLNLTVLTIEEFRRETGRLLGTLDELREGRTSDLTYASPSARLSARRAKRGDRGSV